MWYVYHKDTGTYMLVRECEFVYSELDELFDGDELVESAVIVGVNGPRMVGLLDDEFPTWWPTNPYSTYRGKE